jgi:hypothetical protein
MKYNALLVTTPQGGALSAYLAYDAWDNAHRVRVEQASHHRRVTPAR